MKKTLRNSIIEKRKELSEIYRKEYSMELSKIFFESDLYRNSQKIMSYISIHGEFEMKYINRRILSEGKNLILPKIYEKGRMKAFEVKNLSELQKNSWGLHEPLETIEMEPDLIIVPGVAFDKKGNRMGFGGGFYDRFLEKRRVKTVAFCYEFQMVEELPVEEHDIPVGQVMFL